MFTKKAWRGMEFCEEGARRKEGGIRRGSVTGVVSSSSDRSRCFCVQVLSNDVDLLHPPAELEKRKHKLKRLVQSPNSFFMVCAHLFRTFVL